MRIQVIQISYDTFYVLSRAVFSTYEMKWKEKEKILENMHVQWLAMSYKNLASQFTSSFNLSLHTWWMVKWKWRKWKITHIICILFSSYIIIWIHVHKYQNFSIAFYIFILFYFLAVRGIEQGRYRFACMWLSFIV